MAFFHHITFATFLLSCNIIQVYSRGPVYEPPDVEQLTDRFSRLSVNQSYNVFFGGPNVHATDNGTSADISLDKYSGSGLASKNKYYYGFFNAAIKLPAGFTSGVVVAYYLSNADVFPHNHDEIDIELWFDPTQNFHDYSILWNNHHIVFLVDNVPVREVIHNNAISSAYPSKPMSVYATIWDGSEWATHGGKYPVDYKFAPFIASMRGIEMEGCILNQNDKATSCSRSSPSSMDPVDGEQFAKLSSQQTTGLEWARRKHMFYSYCQDKPRYKVQPAECNAKW